MAHAARDRLIAKLSDTMDPEQAARVVDEAFAQVWNARGAVDLAKIEIDLAQQMGATAAGPYLKHLNRALRALDR
jgi:hypothetical protein